MADFRMTTDIAAVTPQSLDFNFDEIKNWLAESLANDKDIVIREEEIPEAKARRAQINKVSKAINDAKIATKKQYLIPYEKFESQCKELIGMCSEASDNIGAQLNKFDTIRAEQKLETIKEYFESCVGDLVAEYVTFDDIAQKKWGNATYSMEQAKKDVDFEIQKAATDITAIKAFGSEFELTLLDLYKDSHNLSLCVAKKNSLEQAKKDAEERERRIAEKMAQQAAIEKELADHAAKRKAETQAEETEEHTEPTFQVDFRVWCTAKQLNELKTFLKEKGIRYGRA